MVVVAMIGLHSLPSGDVGRRIPTDGTAPDSTGIEVVGGTPRQRQRLFDAVRRFDAAGLTLPDLTVNLGTDPAVCGGALGSFSTRSEPWQITICNEHVTPVYLHELAHAWTRRHLNDTTREAFMELHGLTTWNDPRTPWRDRGMERAAIVIQLGLEDPGHPTRERRVRDRLLGFELLTGISPPRLRTEEMP